MRTVFTVAMLGASANAMINFPCRRADYKTAFNSYALGFQADMTNLNTDCLTSTTTWGDSFTIIGNSFTNLSTSNFMDPVLNIQDMLVEFANLTSNCDFDLFSEQLLTRTTEFSGLFNLAFTIGYGIAAKDEDNQFYSAYDSLMNDNLNCENWSLQMGRVVGAMMNFNTPEENYAT